MGDRQISVLYESRHRENIQPFLEQQKESALEIVELSGEESKEELSQYLNQTSSSYIYIYDDRYICIPNMLETLALYLESNPEVAIAVTPHRFATEDNEVIARAYFERSETIYGCIYNGISIKEAFEKTSVNMIGGAGCCLFRVDMVRDALAEVLFSLINEDNKILLDKIVAPNKIVLIKDPLCFKRLEKASEDLLKEAYASWKFTCDKGKCSDTIQKKITFFYTDKGEYYNLVPIADEAKRRGYETEFTSNIYERAEIGVYCQHVCYPENSRFSLILLHDMAQGHNRWPNLWDLERWDKFDIGILPGDMWGDLWRKCGELYYANPRRGTYTLGYPKSDLVNSTELNERAEELKRELGLKYEYSVLYAPSWENNEKEDDFVRALSSLPVNLLIKQAHWPPQYQFVIDNISKMRELHEGQYENVYYIEPEESILTALKMCNMVVSDESSVMAEALLFDKVSLAVTDWTIPDTDPPRFASVPMDYVLRCKKSELKEYVEKIYSGDMKYDHILDYGKNLFGNRGNVCSMIMDAVDYYLGYGEKTEFLSYRQTPYYLPCM